MRGLESWEQVRIIAYYAAAGNLKKGTKPSSLFHNPYMKKQPQNKRFKTTPKGNVIKEMWHARENLVYEEVKSESALRINHGR